MNSTSLDETCWQKTVRLVRRLLFDSGWDFLKAVVLAGLFFLWGNFLGWFYEPPRSLKVELGYMGDFFEGYGFINLAFDSFEADTGNQIPLSFYPPGLRQMRICRELYLKDTGRGMAYLTRVVDEFSQCIRLDVKTSDKITRATISKAKGSVLLKSVEREGSDHWFCECARRVLNTFAKEADYP